MQLKLPFRVVCFPFRKKGTHLYFNNTEILALQTVDRQR